MLKNEATLIAKMLTPFKGVQVLNVCSGSHHFRVIQQPFIHYVVLQPLLDRKCVLKNLDQRREAGIDIYDDCQVMKSVADGVFDLCLWNNAIEHLPKPDACVAAMHRVLKHGGMLLASGPGAYPYHADPIDTMLRLPERADWEKVLAGRFEVTEFATTKDTPEWSSSWASVVLAKRVG